MHCRLKLPGCTNPRPEGAKAFALTARKPHTNALNTQGVALGWWLLALQAVPSYARAYLLSKRSRERTLNSKLSTLNSKLSLIESTKWGIVSGGFACFYYGGTYIEKKEGEKLTLLQELYDQY